MNESQVQSDQLMRNVTTFIQQIAGTSFSCKKEMYEAYLAQFGGSGQAESNYKSMLDKAFSLGLLSSVRRGRKRTRYYEANDIADISNILKK